MDFEYYKKIINWNTTGRCDLTPLFENPEIFNNLITDLTKNIDPTTIDKVAGLDALGFILGVAVAQKLEKGFVVIRKGGKLPLKQEEILRKEFVDYTKKHKSLEIKRSSIKKGERILIIDEWIETGSQIQTTCNLIEELGGKVEAISVLCAEKKSETLELFENYNLHAIHVFE